MKSSYLYDLEQSYFISQKSSTTLLKLEYVICCFLSRQHGGCRLFDMVTTRTRLYAAVHYLLLLAESDQDSVLY